MPLQKHGVRTIGLAVAAAIFAFAPARDAAAIPSADVLFVVDESISMAGEHAWIGSMVTQLDSALSTAGITGNRYGLVGFVENTGAHGAGSAGPHKHLIGGGDWGTAAQFSAAAGTLSDDGSIFEDGYEGIQFGLDNYGFRNDVAINIVMIADEDRDDTTGGAIVKSSVLSNLIAIGAKLNVVVNNPFYDGTGTSASDRVLGISHDGTWYDEDGSGGFVSGSGGTVGNGAGTTENDYVNGFALHPDIAGAAWDLNLLRVGGNTAESFTDAFVDVKVAEIEDQVTVPEPATLAVIGFGLAVLGFAQRRRAGRA